MAIYFVALVGFLVFYGLDHLRARLRESARRSKAARRSDFTSAGFAAYVVLMAYLLVHDLAGTPTSTALYAFAIAVHFIGVDHALREEHGAAYERVGRFLLAGMAILGWGAGLLIDLPRYVLALCVAFVSGAIIMNSTIMELPSEKDGRFPPSWPAAMIYGLILVALG